MSDTKLAEQADFVRKRITELRLQHNLSEYELSLALGHPVHCIRKNLTIYGSLL